MPTLISGVEARRRHNAARHGEMQSVGSIYKRGASRERQLRKGLRRRGTVVETILENETGNGRARRGDAGIGAWRLQSDGPDHRRHPIGRILRQSLTAVFGRNLLLQRPARACRGTLRGAITRGNARCERTNSEQNHERAPAPAPPILGIGQAKHLVSCQLRRFYHIELECPQASDSAVTTVTALTHSVGWSRRLRGCMSAPESWQRSDYWAVPLRIGARGTIAVAARSSIRRSLLCAS